MLSWQALHRVRLTSRQVVATIGRDHHLRSTSLIICSTSRIDDCFSASTTTHTIVMFSDIVSFSSDAPFTNNLGSLPELFYTSSCTERTPFQDLLEEHDTDIPRWVRFVREELC
ncbi:hypothetical protein BHM03_00026246 [Ensete ventricosum]|nr:hypothetical protein BHM03_00026246 [Ensete ventricosum]